MKYHGGEQVNGICVELNRKLDITYSSNNKWALPIEEFEKLLEPKHD
jgi:hypothetical protein